MKDYYAILGVARNATNQEVRTQFRRLARERHPDRFTGEEKAQAEEEFQRLTEAFNVLNDPEKRRGHDLELFKPEAHRRQEEGAMGKMLIQRGRLAYRSGNYVEAIDNFDRATADDPKNGQAWYYLAQACSRNRRWLSRAVKAIGTAVKLEPTNADYLQLAGDICARANMTRRAERYYQKALAWGADPEEVEEAIGRLTRASETRGDFI